MVCRVCDCEICVIYHGGGACDQPEEYRELASVSHLCIKSSGTLCLAVMSAGRHSSWVPGSRLLLRYTADLSFEISQHSILRLRQSIRIRSIGRRLMDPFSSADAF